MARLMLWLRTQVEGDLETALAELQAALKLDRQDAGAHQALGTVYRQKSNVTAPVEEFCKAEEINTIKMNVQAATLATNNGARQLHDGDVDGAIGRFCDALKLAPNFASAHFQLGMAFLSKGDATQASAEFERLANATPICGRCSRDKNETDHAVEAQAASAFRRKAGPSPEKHWKTSLI